MKHRRPGSFILLASCSYCKNDFRDGAARHMLGSYPMEQFCTYSCAENYLESDRDLTRAIPLTPMIFGKVEFRPLEKRANLASTALEEKARDY